MGLFDSDKSDYNPKAELLADAVASRNSELAIKLLEEAGGSCQARALAKEAVKYGYVGYSLRTSGDSETLDMFRLTRYSTIPVAGIEGKRCQSSTSRKESGR